MLRHVLEELNQFLGASERLLPEQTGQNKYPHGRIAQALPKHAHVIQDYRVYEDASFSHRPLTVSESRFDPGRKIAEDHLDFLKHFCNRGVIRLSMLLFLILLSAFRQQLSSLILKYLHLHKKGIVIWLRAGDALDKLHDELGQGFRIVVAVLKLGEGTGAGFAQWNSKGDAVDRCIQPAFRYAGLIQKPRSL